MMSGVFWIVTTLMTVLAFAFVAQPLFGSKGRKTIIVIAIGLPAFAVGLYNVIGSPTVESGWSSPIAAGTNSAKSSSAGTREKVGSVASMVDKLAARLEENPKNGKGWLLLARSYKHLNRIEDAAYAYSQAESLGELDPQFAALEALPDEAAISSVQIAGSLGLSDRASEIVLPTDTVFVFARAANASGAPAAVLQKFVSDLPIDFLLNDSQSMVDGIKLSDFDKVVVTARISRSGDATEALQGLEAKSEPVAVADNNHVTLIIQ